MQATKPTVLNKLQDFLFGGISIASLVFFRIVFGILAFLDVLITWIWYHLTKDSFNPENYQFGYIGFEWLGPFPDPFMSFIFFLLMILAILITVGYRYRMSALLFGLGFTYLFLLEKSHYLNHAYLFCVLSFIMAFLPAHKAFSYDVIKGWTNGVKQVPRLSILILNFCMGIVYFFGGIAKINSDWLNALPLKLWLPAKKDYFLIGQILEKEWMAWFMSYGGLFLDLFVVPLLLFRKTRWLAFGLSCFFHLTNAAIFKIGIFPWLSIALTALFFKPDFPKRGLDYFKSKFKIIQAQVSKYQQTLLDQNILIADQYQIPSSKRRKWTIMLLIPFILINLSLPLRHHFFEGNVAWTEEGHRYSWRMMLRSKRARGHFRVVNAKTKEEIKIKPKEVLKPKQARKVLTHPDMIWQYAQHLKKKYQKEWNTEDVKVYADVKAKLHKRPYQQYINKEIDLGNTSWEIFKNSNWIMPLKEK